MKNLTPDESLAISKRIDVLEVKIAQLTRQATIDIKLDLLEVRMLLEGIEACDRKWPRRWSQTQPQREGQQ